MEDSFKYLYLASSNSAKEYILDVLETLALPFGEVQHFRYELKWIDNELKKEIPYKSDKVNKIKNTNIIVYYLYLKKEDNQAQFIDTYPIRIGKLEDAYKTGDSDEDIAHFYFKLENYISYNNKIYKSEIYKKVKENFMNKSQNTKGFINGEGIPGLTLVSELDIKEEQIKEFTASKENSLSAFYEICNNLKPEHLTTPEGKKYYPIFHFINGIKDENGNILEPKYDSVSHKSYYSFGETVKYLLEFSTYSPELQKTPNAVTRLLSNSKIFSTPSAYTLNITSRYNEESWQLISNILEQNVWTNISFKTILKLKDKAYDPLNLDINFNVKISRNIKYRAIDIITELLVVIFGALIAVFTGLSIGKRITIVAILIIWFLLRVFKISKWGK